VSKSDHSFPIFCQFFYPHNALSMSRSECSSFELCGQIVAFDSSKDASRWPLYWQGCGANKSCEGEGIPAPPPHPSFPFPSSLPFFLPLPPLSTRPFFSPSLPLSSLPSLPVPLPPVPVFPSPPLRSRPPYCTSDGVHLAILLLLCYTQYRLWQKDGRTCRCRKDRAMHSYVQVKTNTAQLAFLPAHIPSCIIYSLLYI